jgi:hypothetical protein
LNPCCEGLVLPYVSGLRAWVFAYVRAREIDTNLVGLNSNTVFVISVVKFVGIVVDIMVIMTTIIITFVCVIRVAL